MAYRDKDRQRQADRARQQRRRDKVKAKGVTSEGVTQGVMNLSSMVANMMAEPVVGVARELTPGVIPEQGLTVDTVVGITLMPNFGLPGCQCMHCQQNRANGSKRTINHGSYKPAPRLARGEVNRVPLPGDVDYKGVADSHPEWPRAGR